jgi:hypothetical protein
MLGSFFTEKWFVGSIKNYGYAMTSHPFVLPQTLKQGVSSQFQS